jgi:DNA repair exonuclease SbcCD ATPase subunit
MVSELQSFENNSLNPIHNAIRICTAQLQTLQSIIRDKIYALQELSTEHHRLVKQEEYAWYKKEAFHRRIEKLYDTLRTAQAEEYDIERLLEALSLDASGNLIPLVQDDFPTPTKVDNRSSKRRLTGPRTRYPSVAKLFLRISSS